MNLNNFFLSSLLMISLFTFMNGCKDNKNARIVEAYDIQPCGKNYPFRQCKDDEL
jgi:hypothetical protein